MHLNNPSNPFLKQYYDPTSVFNAQQPHVLQQTLTLPPATPIAAHFQTALCKQFAFSTPALQLSTWKDFMYSFNTVKKQSGFHVLMTDIGKVSK